MQDLVLIILALFSIAYASPNPAKCHCGIPHYENYTARIYKGREEVRDGAGVALATPFFQDLSICHLDFWPYGLLAIRSSGLLAI